MLLNNLATLIFVIDYRRWKLYLDMKELFNTINARYKPEYVAETIKRKFAHNFSEDDLNIISLALLYSFDQDQYEFSSMPVRFHETYKVARHVLEIGVSLFPKVPLNIDHVAAHPEKFESYAQQASKVINKDFGSNDFKTDRLNKEQRKNAGLDISKRQYNKRFRYLKRLESKSKSSFVEKKKYQLTLVGKSGLASFLPFEEFSKDEKTACFIAYYVARCNLRSEFTVDGQKKAYDEIAERLFSVCKKSETTNWWAIAHVFPEKEVLKKLTDKQKGQLLGCWYKILEEISLMLSQVWATSNIDVDTMVVKRGNDSSTWNNMANAWNKARVFWFALNDSLDSREVTDAVCFGKVLRLMAGDVAAWHKSSGGGLDPDTKVWKELPFPWEVLQGTASCNKSHVISVCKKHGVDPVEGGWIGPKSKVQAVKFTPTPELVHGVTVSNPNLALVLRKAGFFSGKV